MTRGPAGPGRRAARAGRWKRLGIALLALGLAGAGAALATRGAIPHTRLALDAAYPDMPADARHRYLTLPLDHDNPGRGAWRAFYILSPHFDPHGPVVFVMTDGQMELVDTGVDFAFFDAQVPGASYVLVGHRGHSPTLFPEVYPGDRRDVAAAMKLYGSWQRVEDIERVRQDMAAAGLLPADGRIMLFGASGAGVLAQQYLHRHGQHVSRAFLASTGAPDLARLNGWTFARKLAELDPETARALETAARDGDGVSPGLAYMLFQLGRRGAAGLAGFHEVVRGSGSHATLAYATHWFDPGLNWALGSRLMDSPAADAAKVRMVELMGADLEERSAARSAGEPLLYTWSADMLQAFLDAHPALPDLRLDRSRFKGEVLVVSGAQDIVFSPAVGKAIASAYPDGRFLLVPGGHRLERDQDYQRALRSAFFRHGLHAAETQALLGKPPRGP